MAAYGGFEISPLVLDTGSGVVKVGTAESQWPEAEVPNVIGEAKHKRALLSAMRRERTFGSEALFKRGLYKIKRPMTRGVVSKMSEQIDVWEYIYKDILKYSSTQQKEHPVLLTDAAENPIWNRVEVAKTFFEAFEAPALFFAPQPILSLYATGRMTGCVLDSGHGVTQCLPIYDGFAMPHAATRMDVAGMDVDKYFQLLLRKLSGMSFHTSAELELIRDIKEKHCEIMSQAPSDSSSSSSATSSMLSGIGGSKKVSRLQDDEQNAIRVELPDKRVLQLGSARWKSPELLFDPSLVGLEYRGIQYTILDAVAKTDLDLRRGLFQHILLSGGSTMFKGFGARLLNELKSCSDMESPKFKIYAPLKRNLTAWAGGSVLASLQSFNPMWITRQEYDESGDRILLQKTFL